MKETGKIEYTHHIGLRVQQWKRPLRREPDSRRFVPTAIYIIYCTQVQKDDNDDRGILGVEHLPSRGRAEVRAGQVPNRKLNQKGAGVSRNKNSPPPRTTTARREGGKSIHSISLKEFYQ